MKRILFPTDLSDMTKHALVHAVHLAKITDSELILVNAFEMEYLDPRIRKESYEMGRDETMEKLEELKQRVLIERGNQDLKIRCFPAYGSLVSSIEETAEHFGVDLIVMATNGVSELQEFFTGSHTQRVIDEVDCPVLVIPEDAEFKSFDNILFASDLNELPSEQLKTLMEVARAEEAELHIVNVGPEKKKKAMEKALWHFEKEHLYDDVDHRWEFVENEDVLKGLESYIDEHREIDMLVMVSHERRDWLENFVSPRLTKKVVHHPFLPTMIVKY